MLFRNENVCVFKGCKELTSTKSGIEKKFTVVSIADPVAMETQDFFPANPKEWEKCKVGDEVIVGLEYDGRFTNIVLCDATAKA